MAFDRVLVFREDGSLVVGQVSREGFRSLRRYQLGGERMWGHPAVVESRIIVKDGSRLAAHRLGAADGRSLSARRRFGS